MPRRTTSTVLAFAAAIAAAAAARRCRALSPSGAVAATIVGGVIAAGNGPRGAAALLTFFASSTVLGRLPSTEERRQQRGNERDAVQVLANGGVAGLFATMIAFHVTGTPDVLLTGFGGALATATADTWATEIGSRSRQRPRSIASGRLVPTGASGGVTWAGTSAAAAGAATIAAVLTAGRRHSPPPFRSVRLAIAAGGFCGALADSVLGAIVQEVRFCDVCEEESEMRLHVCRTPTQIVRGWPGFTNDVVNALATAVGATMAMIVVHRLPRSFGDPKAQQIGDPGI